MTNAPLEVLLLTSTPFTPMAVVIVPVSPSFWPEMYRKSPFTIVNWRCQGRFTFS